MKHTKTTITIQLELVSDSKITNKHKVLRKVIDLNEFSATKFNLEVEDGDVKVAHKEDHSIVTNKYKANSVAELFNNLGEAFPYTVMRMLTEYARLISVQATDEEVEVENEVDDE